MLFLLTPIRSEADSIQQDSEVIEQTAKYEKNQQEIETKLKENKDIVKQYNKKVKLYRNSVKSYLNFNTKKKIRYKFTFKKPYNIPFISLYGSQNLDLQYKMQKQLIEDIHGTNKKLKKDIKRIQKETKEIRTMKHKFIDNQKRNPNWDGAVLNTKNGVVTGPLGKETYYNLNMSGVVRAMRGLGNEDEYWVRKDGCKMLGDYIMVAANLKKYPKGTIVETSLGKGIVCDTGGFVHNGSGVTFDIATNWK
jgi:hypothetical protein